MISEYECHLAVKLKNSMKATNEKTPERIELFLILKNYFRAIYFYFMVGSKEINKIIEPEVVRVLGGLAIFLINFFNDAISNHSKYRNSMKGRKKLNYK